MSKKEKTLQSLRNIRSENLQGGISHADAMSEDVFQGRQRKHIDTKNETDAKFYRDMRRILIWLAGLCSAALFIVFVVLLGRHIYTSLSDPQKVEMLLGRSMEYVLVAMSALFIERKIRDK